MAEMKQLPDLINHQESALQFVQALCCRIPGRCEMLPPSPLAGDALIATQVTTRSPMGAIIYHTGGIVIDHRWLRILGSGRPAEFRSLPDWNRDKANGFWLVADDAAGGFFALDGGVLGFEPGHVCYWAPDSLEWMSLKGGYSEFLTWACTGDLAEFYEDLRWAGWQDEVRSMPLDRCMGFYPFLWTEAGGIEQRRRATVPVQEALDLKVDVLRQLTSNKVDE